MKESDIIFPSIVETFLKQGMNSIDEQEAADIHQFLEMVYAEQPCNEKAVYGLIKIYNAKKEFEQAKEIGQSFIMMDGYNKDILGELSITFLSLNQMDTYFSLVKQHLEKEAQLEDVPNDDFSEESNVIPFPKKNKTASQHPEFFRMGNCGAIGIFATG
ncbi:tetratricopeptide repeat protein [Paenilisteria weihenstephanensis]|uniref:tetratricopeptide repeat protein n=1 Tax=Listeria weihenstephanensis TaxID=1006155 RepID=UPI0004B32373|nr:tetratricopeptide repeat protein [Listeria weihenstephanensis]